MQDYLTPKHIIAASLWTIVDLQMKILLSDFMNSSYLTFNPFYNQPALGRILHK